MNTEQRAQAIAEAAQPFHALLGPTSPDDLLAWVTGELGDAGALDGWVSRGVTKTKAVAPHVILHIVSGNTPHAALQSLVGGLLLGSRNLVKLPHTGLVEVDEFVSRLPEPLAAMVETSDNLMDEWIVAASAVVVYGSDETVAHLRARVPAEKTFIGYGHKVSLGMIWDDPDLSSCAGAARDASLYDQRGCLSPHVFYVRETAEGFVRAYAEKLASEMDRFNRTHPRSALSLEERAAIANLRAAVRFRATEDPHTALWEGGGNLDWTVVYDRAEGFPLSPLNRVVFVRPLPHDFPSALGIMVGHIGAVGLFPCMEELADRCASLQPSRFCPVGRMQDPPWTWHNSGVARLASLVKWVDFEPASGFTG